VFSKVDDTRHVSSVDGRRRARGCPENSASLARESASPPPAGATKYRRSRIFLFMHDVPRACPLVCNKPRRTLIETRIAHTCPRVARGTMRLVQTVASYLLDRR